LDGTQDTTNTSLTLIGRKSLNYGQFENQNIVRLLENFAYSLPPINSIIGQIWYNTTTRQLNVYNGTNWTTQATTGYVDAAITNSLLGNLALQSGNFSGNVVASALISNTAVYSGTGFFYQNGIPYYSNSNVAAFLTVSSIINQLQANTIQLQANITAANAAIITANAGVVSYVNAQITNVSNAQTANAQSQQTEISTINANVAAANVAIAVLQTNPVYANANVASYLPTDSTILTINSNIAAANAAITVLQTNPAYGNANVGVYLPYDNTIVSIVQTSLNQQSQINSINANVNAANLSISAANASIVGVSISWTANAATQATEIAALRANISSANALITSVSINSTANAATQATEIAGLRANINAANTAISNININSNVSGNISGNILSSNIARFVYVSTLAPGVLQGNIGDIWYQTF
jgi:hypothetical protein